MHRLDRVEAALRLAVTAGYKVEKADAADWVERRFARPQRPGTVRVLYHTVVWSVPAAATRARITAALAVAGRAASPAAPVAHLAVEGDGQPDARIDLTLWPGGATVALGRADFHGRWVNGGGLPASGANKKAGSGPPLDCSAARAV